MRRRSSVLLAAAMVLLVPMTVLATIGDGSLAAPGGLAPTGDAYNPTHWSVLAGDTVTGQILGATDVPDVSTCSNGEPGVDVFIKSSSFGNTTLCGSLTDNNDTITFIWQVPSEACNTTNVAYWESGNTANNDLIDDGLLNGTGQSTAGYAIVDTNGDVVDCGGGRTTVAGPTASKDASGSYTHTFGWTIDKSVDQPDVTTAGGASATANYTITLTKDDGTISAIEVHGTITVDNGASGDITLSDITDTLSDNTVCTVDKTGGLTVRTGSTDFPYTCTVSGSTLPETNTAVVSWDAQDVGTNEHVNAGSSTTDAVAIDWTANPVNECIHVSDTNPAGPLAQEVCDSGTIKYSSDVTGPAGTCTLNPNTASIDGTDQSADATVNDCQGANLTVTKTATPAFTRTYAWDIAKAVDQTKITVDQGGTATFNYTVTVHHNAGTDSGWTVSGNITVTNPNDWETVAAHVSDAVNNGGTCLVEGVAHYNYTLAAGESKNLSYVCTYSSAPSPSAGKNTATVTWDAEAASTTDGSADYSVDFAFTTPTTLVDNCVDVTDTNVVGTLGTVCVGDANPTIFHYPKGFTGPAWGTCASHDNTATFTTNTIGTTGSARQTVQVCSFKAALTIGYWGNHLAPTGTPGCTGRPALPSGTGCSNNGPWTNQYLGNNTTICTGCVVGQLTSTYTVTTFQQAAAVFAANNCSNSSTSDSNAASCLAAQLLAAELNVANGANSCICPTIKNAKAFLTAVLYTGPGSTVHFTSTYTRAGAIALKTALDNYNNGIGCH